jgi:hypothetical protein
MFDLRLALEAIATKSSMEKPFLLRANDRKDNEDATEA